MGIKNIKLHIVTDIKVKVKCNKKVIMANTVETPVTEPIEEKKVEKETVVDLESKTTEAEHEENGNGKAETEDGNGHGEETEKEETTLKRKDAPTEVEEDSPKKKKLIETDEKEPEAAVEA